MTYTKAQIFTAFRLIHNKNMEGDIYLPSDQPEVMDDCDGAAGGVWIHHCAVWISDEEIDDALRQIAL